MDKTDRKRLKRQGIEEVTRRSQELRDMLNAENPWPVGSDQWVARYKELHQLRRDRGARISKSLQTDSASKYGGVLADIYLSREEEATDYDTRPEQFSDRAQYRRITTLELSTLWAIMRKIEWDVASMDAFACLLQRDDGERLIHKLPAEMVADLASLTAVQIDIVTPQWAAIEELGWETNETRPVLEDLIRLASQATKSNRSMYLWNCI